MYNVHATSYIAVAVRCTTEAFSTTCAVHIEDCERWWLSGCRSSVAEHGNSNSFRKIVKRGQKSMVKKFGGLHYSLILTPHTMLASSKEGPDSGKGRLNDPIP